MSAVRATYRFARIPEWVLYHPDLSAEDVRVFGILDRFDGHDCFPSLASIAEKMQRSEDTVRRSIRRLETVGAVLVEVRTTDEGRQTSNRYLLAGDQQPCKGALAAVPPPGVAAVQGGEGGTGATRSRAREDPEQEDPETTVASLSADFVAWYACYPVHKGRAGALRAYRTARKTTSQEVLLNAAGVVASRYKADRPNRRQFYKHPATWLNQECWLDEDGGAHPNSTGRAPTATWDPAQGIWLARQ